MKWRDVKTPSHQNFPVRAFYRGPGFFVPAIAFCFFVCYNSFVSNENQLWLWPGAKGVHKQAMYDYLIVGAGLYGAVFAHEAAKAGKK